MVLGHQTLGNAVYRGAAYCRADCAGAGKLLVGAAGGGQHYDGGQRYYTGDVCVLHGIYGLLQR